MVVGFIVGGLILIAISFILALPFSGIGLIIPIVGDVIDIPLAFVFGLVGLILLTIGITLSGLSLFISEFWWVIPIGFAIWLVVIIMLGFAKKTLKK